VRIAISATGPSLDAEVDPRFGRCQYFVIVDPDTLEFEALENTSQMASGGAGIASAQTVANKGVQAVLTGNCGPNAYQTLEAAGIEVITGVSGTIRDAVEGYKSGRFRATSGPSVGAHFGMGGGGTGMGGGMGMGRGMGSGMGYAPPSQAPGMPPYSPTMPQLSPEEELQNLKQQAELLRQQMENITKRIDQLQKKK